MENKTDKALKQQVHPRAAVAPRFRGLCSWESSGFGPKLKGEELALWGFLALLWALVAFSLHPWLVALVLSWPHRGLFTLSGLGLFTLPGLAMSPKLILGRGNRVVR